MHKWFILLALVGSCKQEVTSQLTLLVQDNKGEAVPFAQVTLDELAIGQTDAKGQFSYPIKAEVGELKKLAVSKESSTSYYAPYYDKLSFQRTSPPQLSLKAILYAVPKAKAAKL